MKAEGVQNGMKKALILTLYGENNYGNRLQHTALQEVLERLGLEVSTHTVKAYGKLPPYPIGMAKRICKKLLGVAVPRYRNASIREVQLLYTRRRMFRHYNRRHIHRPIVFQDFAPAASPEAYGEFDYVVAGSDQIWHSSWGERNPAELPYFYMENVPDEKRVAYAASFGFTEFPEEDAAIHARNLRAISRLSVREAEMVPMIQALAGRTPELVLDPTLLLDAEWWHMIAGESRRGFPEHCVVVYLLGSRPEGLDRVLRALGERGYTEVVDVSPWAEKPCGPAEFVAAVEHADYVLTDSFHGAAFSILFHKNLLVFRRNGTGEGMFGRLSGLLELCGMGDHIDEGAGRIPGGVDYASVDRILDRERIRSIQCLRRCIEIPAESAVEEMKTKQVHKAPLVSVVVPCYNMEHKIERLLESLQRQTWTNNELIFVDDGSVDGTGDVILNYRERFEALGMRFQYFRQENQGVSAAINTGLRNIHGDYLIWPDADDWLEDRSIQTRVEFLEQNPQYAVVTSNAYIYIW